MAGSESGRDAHLLPAAAADLLGAEERVRRDPLQDPHRVAEHHRHGAPDRLLERRGLRELADQPVHEVGGEGRHRMEAEDRLDVPHVPGVLLLRVLRRGP
jgi:hypothetical protein